MPSRDEIKEIIKEKKDKKATTDWKNILLKREGKPMVDFIMPVIRAFWLEEEAPPQWNQGIITNVWKGKGDCEKMENQRGITLSSSIGTIAEGVINRRLIKTIKFTQAQAGGKKGASTTDHVFILRNIMEIAKKEGRLLLISYFDVNRHTLYLCFGTTAWAACGWALSPCGEMLISLVVSRGLSCF